MVKQLLQKQTRFLHYSPVLILKKKIKKRKRRLRMADILRSRKTFYLDLEEGGIIRRGL